MDKPQINLICDGIPDFSYEGTDIYNSYFREISIDILNYISDKTVDIIETHIDDINLKSNDIFYFILPIQSMEFYEVITNFIDNEESPFIKKLKYLINLNNVKTLCVDVHESTSVTTIDNFITQLKKNNTIGKNFYLINNDFKLNDYNIQYGWNINTHKINHLISRTSGGLLETDFNFLQDKPGPFFLCKNKQPKPHRIFTLSFLDRYGILDSVNYSYIRKPDYTDWIPHGDAVVNLDNSLDEYIKKYLNSNFKLTKGELTDTSILDETQFVNFAGYLNIDDYKNSYVNIVTESIYFSDNIHITEKSIKPFIFYQLPIIIASPYHVKYLRDEYGLDAFDDLIDHSYDLEENHYKRFFLVMNEIKRLNTMKGIIKDFYNTNQNRFESNRNILQKLSLSKYDYPIFELMIS